MCGYTVQVKALYNASLAEMEAGVYQPRTIFTCIFSPSHGTARRSVANSAGNLQKPDLALLALKRPEAGRASKSMVFTELQSGQAGQGAVAGARQSDGVAAGAQPNEVEQQQGGEVQVDGLASLMGDGDAEAD